MPEAIQASSREFKADFYEWIRRPQHTYRTRMSSEKQQILQMFFRPLDCSHSIFKA